MIERYQTVLVDGSPVRLRYTVNAVYDLEQETGKPWTQLAAELNPMGLGACVPLLRAARLWEQPTMTEADSRALIQEWVDAGMDLQELSKALLLTFETSGFLKPVPTRARDGAADPNGKRRTTIPKGGSARRNSGARASASSRRK